MGEQHLLMGFGLPFFGALADQWGPVGVLSFGGAVYASGTFLMTRITNLGLFHVVVGIITGFGISATSFTLVMASFARTVPPKFRSLVLGLGTASGSLGQTVFAPICGALLNSHDWIFALTVLSIVVIAIIPLSWVLPNGPEKGAVISRDSIKAAVNEAMSHRGYLLLTAGFFVCGFHVAFVGVHLPSLLANEGFEDTGAAVLALIGGCNVVGSMLSGWVGQRTKKKHRPLAILYLLRLPFLGGFFKF